MEEGGKEEQSNNNGDGKNKGNGMLGLGIVFVVAAVIAIVAPAVLLNSGDDPTEAPVLATTTSSPTFASLFSPNSPEACATISQGGTVPDQDEMIWKSFNLTMDVSLTSDLYDYNKVADHLQSRMQQIVAPKLADCPDSRRLRAIDGIHDDANRKLLAEHAIGNVLFDLRLDDSTRSCDDGAPSPCIVVNTNMVLYLKSDQNRLPLTQKVSNMFEESALKSDPFALITIAGQQEVTMTPTSVPSVVPTSPTLAPNLGGSTPEDCARIATGLPVPDQDLMRQDTFILNFNVLLTLEVSDLLELVLSLESRMQEVIAPMLADCPSARRLRGILDLDETERKMLEEDVIGNALFKLSHVESETCTGGARVCIRVDATLNLFLKDHQARLLDIIVHVADILYGENGELVDVLGLSSPFAEIVLASISHLDITESPSSLPTGALLYAPNSPEECAAISRGELAPSQDSMISKTFDIRMDVSLTLQLSDLGEVVQEIESRLQRILGPKFADCPEERRLQETNGAEGGTVRHLLEKHLVANALFDAVYEEDEVCDASAKTPCIRVLAKLTMILKGEELSLTLVNRIAVLLGSEPLADVLGLTAPFNTIEVVDVTAATVLTQQSP